VSGAKLFYGAGIYIQGPSSASPAQPVITTNVIDGNTADPPDGTYSDPARAFGGGIYAGYYSSPRIVGNEVVSNSVGDATKVNIRASGGGLAMYSLVPGAVISQNVVQSNFSAINGGGVAFGAVFDSSTSGYTPSQGTADSNLFLYNYA